MEFKIRKIWTEENDSMLMQDLLNGQGIYEMAKKYNCLTTTLEKRLANFAAKDVRQQSLSVLEACSKYRVTENMVIHALKNYPVGSDSDEIGNLKKKVQDLEKKLQDMETKLAPLMELIR